MTTAIDTLIRNDMAKAKAARQHYINWSGSREVLILIVRSRDFGPFIPETQCRDYSLADVLELVSQDDEFTGIYRVAEGEEPECLIEEMAVAYVSSTELEFEGDNYDDCSLVTHLPDWVQEHAADRIEAARQTWIDNAGDPNAEHRLSKVNLV